MGLSKSKKTSKNIGKDFGKMPIDEKFPDAERLINYMMRYRLEMWGHTGSYEIRRWLNQFILLGLVWVEDGVPEDNKVRFQYQLNPRPLEIQQLDKKLTRRIHKYPKDDLEFICKKLKQPEWAVKRNSPRGKTSLFEVGKVWADVLFSPFLRAASSVDSIASTRTMADRTTNK